MKRLLEVPDGPYEGTIATMARGFELLMQFGVLAQEATANGEEMTDAARAVLDSWTPPEALGKVAELIGLMTGAKILHDAIMATLARRVSVNGVVDYSAIPTPADVMAWSEEDKRRRGVA